ncbi:MAG: hypothetical protein JWN52_8069 [Actinomycetia bacterium]|nr:hypothetical protein [Actinomycetes bacterium]
MSTRNRGRSAASLAERFAWAAFPAGTPTGGDHGHAPGQGRLTDCQRCKAEKAPRRGWPWKQRRSSDPAVIWENWPADDPNFGVACEPSNLVVFDLDTPKPGQDLPPEWQTPGVNEGADVLAVLCEQRGEEWPHTFTVRTASGGTHLYYQAIQERPIRNSAGKVGPMIDVRAGFNADGTPGGGYVVGPGSIVGGAPYEVVIDSDPIPLPSWLADLADPPTPVRPPSPQVAPRAAEGGRPRSRFVGLLDTLLNAPVGQRNNVLHWVACRAVDMVGEGQVEPYAAQTALMQAAESIGLSEHESRATISSAFGRAA